MVTSVSRAPSRRQPAVTVFLYVAYFVLAGIGQATGSIALSATATAWYFLVAVALCLLFASSNRRAGVAALTFAAIGCVVQGVGQVQLDTSLQTSAIAFFGLFEIVLAYLIARSQFAPRWLGAALALAGVAGIVTVFAPLPTAARYGVVAVSGLAELALLLWLIARAVRGFALNATPAGLSTRTM